MFFDYALKEIKRRKLRSMASIVGYIIAVAFLIIAVTFSQGYNSVAAGALNRIGTHFVVYVPASTKCPCEIAEVGPFFRDTYTPTFNLDIVETVATLPGVADASPCLMFRFDNLTICGVNFDSLATKTNVVSSNMLVKGDYSRVYDSDAVLVDSIFAELAKIDVGENLTAFDRTFTVVGLVNPALYSRPAGIANIYAPLGVVQEIAKYYGDIYNFAVKDINIVLVEISSEGDEAHINAVEQSVLGTIESYAGQDGAVVGYQCGVSARKVIPITEDSAWALSVVVIASVMLFALKSQLASVLERTKEIGILKAIGWTNSDVTKQVFFESLIQGLCGGTIGVGIGYLVVFLVPQLSLLSTQNLVLAVSPFVVLLGLILALCGAILAGTFPAWHAAKLQPAEALRHF
jgi:ABC-type antimicrobial peptide transport system permease subunit